MMNGPLIYKSESKQAMNAGGAAKRYDAFDHTANIYMKSSDAKASKKIYIYTKFAFFLSLLCVGSVIYANE